MRPIEYTEGVYRTPSTPPSALARAFPALTLYTAFFAIVLRANRLAVRGQYGDDQLCASSLAVLRLLERIGVRFEISGIQHLRDLAGPCVVIANHMSTLETVILPVIVLPFRRVTFIVKQSLLTYPIFGPIMRSLEPLPVTRTNPRLDLKTVLEGGVAHLQQGASIVVFPQTTRTVAFDPALFTSIGVKLAQRAGVPVVPLALLTDAWGNGRLVKEAGPVDPARDVRFAFGEPLLIRGRGNEEQHEIARYIGARLEEWSTARSAQGLPPLPLVGQR